MAIQFQRNRDIVYRDVMLNINYRAEKVLLLPGIGLVDTQEEFDAIVNEAIAADQYMICSIDEMAEGPIYDDAGRKQFREDEIKVLCCRDAFAANSQGELLRGLPQPTIQDGILRTTDDDEEQRIYVYRGEKEDESTVVHRLVFRRYLRFRSSIVEPTLATPARSAMQTNIDNAYLDQHLSLDFHAEQVLLLPGIGLLTTQAEFDTVVDAARAAGNYMTCSIDELEEDPIFSEQERGATRHESITVLCARDDAATNSNGDLLRGISRPDLRFGILRMVGEDREQRVYLFRGDIEDRGHKVHRLGFQRYLRFRAPITVEVVAAIVDLDGSLLLDLNDEVAVS